MAVRVEFFGLARERAGVAEMEVEAKSVGAALRQVSNRLPQLQDVCLDGNRLRAGYLANINGRTFVSDPCTVLRAGDSLLILSSDVGG